MLFYLLVVPPGLLVIFSHYVLYRLFLAFPYARLEAKHFPLRRQSSDPLVFRSPVACAAPFLPPCGSPHRVSHSQRTYLLLHLMSFQWQNQKEEKEATAKAQAEELEVFGSRSHLDQLHGAALRR